MLGKGFLTVEQIERKYELQQDSSERKHAARIAQYKILRQTPRSKAKQAALSGTEEEFQAYMDKRGRRT